jgi:phosphoglycolate phosphatase
MLSKAPDFSQVQALLFDLDGTLIDSVQDLAISGNAVRLAKGLPALEQSRIAGYIGDGIEALVSRLLETQDAAGIRQGCDAFKRHYRDHCMDHTRLYEGAAPVLEALHRRGYGMAVVTNKPEGVTRHMLDALGVAGLFGSVVGGNTLSVKKPDPAPLRKACADLQVPPHAAVMIGDSRVDVEAGRALQIPTLAFSGRIGDPRLLLASKPDVLLGGFSDLLHHFAPRH